MNWLIWTGPPLLDFYGTTVFQVTGLALAISRFLTVLIEITLGGPLISVGELTKPETVFA